MGYHVRVKVCGITTRDDARQAGLAGADAVGLNFHPASPRSVDDATAADLLQALPPFVDAVGVFVDVPLAEAASRLRRLGRFSAVQMHGVRREIGVSHPLGVIPAFAVRGPEDLVGLRSHLAAWEAAGCRPAALLVDGHAPGLFGGTGVAAPWDLLADFTCPVPLILAGGLTPDNVAEAVRRVRPYAVDVASGVESAPGRKDPGKVLAFIERAREAARG